MLQSFITFLFLIPLVSCGGVTIAGGAVAWKNQDIFNEFNRRAMPAVEDNYVGIITAGVPLSIAKSTADAIASQLGAHATDWVPLHPDNGTTCSSDEWNSWFNEMTGLYFNGGDVVAIVNCLSQSPALPIIQSRYARGDLAIFGSSAGTMALQSTPIRSTRESWDALVYGSTWRARAGLGIFTEGFLDVHFSTKERLGALVRFVYDYRNYSTLGFGIDQDTAFATIDNHCFEVVGTNGVSIIDVSEAEEYSPDGNGKRWAVKNVKVSYLTSGDWYNVSSREINYGVNKVRILESDSVRARTTSNVFENGEFVSVARSLLMSNETETSGTTIENNPRYKVDFRKEEDSVWTIIYESEVISFQNLHIDIYCALNC